jgi:Ca2+/H+ antiporter
MSPDLWFLLVLAIKMAVAAAFVVTASFIAERAGALVGAMVMTLPVGAGPAYVLLALDHGAAFIAESTVASLAIHAASGIFRYGLCAGGAAPLLRVHHGGDARARSFSTSPPMASVCRWRSAIATCEFR